jgi:integrase/recombinase XerD
MWNQWVRDFLNYLRLERGMSPNTVMAYKRDLGKLQQWAEEENLRVDSIVKDDLRKFTAAMSGSISPRSQARMVSAIRSFFLFLLEENYRKDHPAELLRAPKLGLYLPDTLSLQEIDAMVIQIDLSKPEGHRDLAILETLYGCGLRVSECNRSG